MKLAIITGASRGIGAAFSEIYKAKGFQVKDLSRSGKSDESVKVDLANIDNVLATIPSLFKSLAKDSLEEVIFINNAGMVLPLGLTSHQSNFAIIQNINVNYTAPILILTEFLRHFQNLDCSKIIINITSGAAHATMHGSSLYSGAKAGFEHIIRIIAVEQAAQNYPILAYNFNPGMVDTSMQSDVRQSSEEDFPLLENFKQAKQGGHLKSPQITAAKIVEIVESKPESGSGHRVDDYFNS